VRGVKEARGKKKTCQFRIVERRDIYTTFLPLLSAFSFALNTWFTKRNTERGRFSSLSAGNRREDIYFIKNSL
jgi:hypothetical protein